MEENISVRQLIEILINFKVDMVCVDNISEIIKVEDLAIHILENNIELRLLTGLHSNSQSVVDLARQEDISIKGKPDSLKTAIICSQLARVHGMHVTLVKKGDKIGFEHDIEIKSFNQIVSSKLNGSTVESTHREAFDQATHSVYIKSLSQVVGYGKESIVYTGIGLQDEEMIVKLFRTYSSVSKLYKSKIHKAKIGHMPLLMAKNEAKNLKLLKTHDFPVPKPYFLDDHMVGMEKICYDGGLAPTLVEFARNVVPHEVVEDYLYHALEMLQDLFSKSKLVHGDYSANNLLVSDQGLVIIDVAQTLLINTNTYTTTPDRIRLDKALDTLFRDLNGIATFFEKSFRVTLERDLIFDEFCSVIPKNFADQVEFVENYWRNKFIFR